jgi:hypothetical protein
MMILHHIGRLEIFVIDRVVLLNERQCRLVMKVPPLASHCLMRPGKQLGRFAPAIAPLLAS